jgi:hypothetical protein
MTYHGFEDGAYVRLTRQESTSAEAGATGWVDGSLASLHGCWRGSPYLPIRWDHANRLCRSQSNGGYVPRYFELAEEAPQPARSYSVFRGYYEGERVEIERANGSGERGYVDSTVVCTSGWGEPGRPWEGSEFVPIRLDSGRSTGWLPGCVRSLCPRKP